MKWLHGKNLFLVCAALMITTRSLFVIKQFVPNPWNYGGIVLIVLGLYMAIRVVKLFDRKDTEIHTFGNPRKLIISDLYRFSRNPCYLGFFISLLGLWLLLGTLLPVFGCLLFISVSNFWHIPYEEKAMAQLFGQEYEVYRGKVRRWI